MFHTGHRIHVCGTIVESLVRNATLGLQIAQSRPYSYTLGPKVGIIYRHGASGLPHEQAFFQKCSPLADRKAPKLNTRAPAHGNCFMESGTLDIWDSSLWALSFLYVQVGLRRLECVRRFLERASS